MMSVRTNIFWNNTLQLPEHQAPHQAFEQNIQTSQKSTAKGHCMATSIGLGTCHSRIEHGLQYVRESVLLQN